MLLDTLEGGAHEGAVRVRLAFGGNGSSAASGSDATDALMRALRRSGHTVEVRSLTEQELKATEAHGERTAAYAEIVLADSVAYGVGIHRTPEFARVHAILSAVNRAHRR